MNTSSMSSIHSLLSKAYQNVGRSCSVVKRANDDREVAGSNATEATRKFWHTACVLEETLKAVCPFYLVSMPGEVKYPAQGGKCVTLFLSVSDILSF